MAPEGNETQVVGVRLDPDTVARLQRLADEESHPGNVVPLSATLRMVLLVGLDAVDQARPLAERMRAELGVVSPLRLALGRIATSGVQGAHRQTDSDVTAAQQRRGPKGTTASTRRRRDQNLPDERPEQADARKARKK